MRERYTVGGLAPRSRRSSIEGRTTGTDLAVVLIQAPTAVLVSYDNGAFDHFVADCRATEARERGKGDAEKTAEEGVPIAFCPMEQQPSVTRYNIAVLQVACTYGMYVRSFFRIMLMVTALFGVYLVAIGACMFRPMVCARAIGELSRDLERTRKMPRG